MTMKQLTNNLVGTITSTHLLNSVRVRVPLSLPLKGKYAAHHLLGGTGSKRMVRHVNVMCHDQSGRALVGDLVKIVPIPHYITTTNTTTTNTTNININAQSSDINTGNDVSELMNTPLTPHLIQNNGRRISPMKRYTLAQIIQPAQRYMDGDTQCVYTNGHLRVPVGQQQQQVVVGGGGGQVVVGSVENRVERGVYRDMGII